MSAPSGRYVGWDVRMRFKRKTSYGESSFESGVNSGWPVGTSPMTVIREAAEMRSVDLSECHTIEATMLDVEWEIS